MPSTLDIRRRIKSVKNTAQITKAMQMVAAAKMRKAQAAALAGRPYQEMLTRVLAALKSRVDPTSHQLLAVRPVKQELILIFSTDKGLCGPLNTNLFRELAEVDPAKSEYAVSGRKAVQYITRTRRKLTADFALKDTIYFSEVRPIARFVSDKSRGFREGNCAEARVGAIRPWLAIDPQSWTFASPVGSWCSGRCAIRFGQRADRSAGS